MSSMYEDMRKLEEKHNLVITAYVSVEDIKAELDEVRDEQIKLSDERIFGIIQWSYGKYDFADDSRYFNEYVCENIIEENEEQD
tara:strand:+ start:171 stop:422 length:252 start_codon:yes stop_codon:yes gene_type:complete